MKALIASVDIDNIRMDLSPPGAPKSASAKITIEVVSRGAWNTDENGYLNTEEIANLLAMKMIEIKEIEF